MHALSNADFLSLWERGRRLHPLDQGLLAIHAGFPELSGESVADWPLGRRNRALLELRCFHFGSALQCWTSCPQCGEKLELNMDARDLIRQSAEQQASHPQPVETVAVRGQTFRLPTSRDLARVAREMPQGQDAAAVRLLEVCRVRESGDREENWSNQDVEEIGERMTEADPLAEIVLAFPCPACSNTCNETLDLPTFLWTEMEAEVRRLLFEIHTLASAYGWTEEEILKLSDARRRLYLEMVQA